MKIRNRAFSSGRADIYDHDDASTPLSTVVIVIVQVHAIVHAIVHSFLHSPDVNMEEDWDIFRLLLKCDFNCCTVCQLMSAPKGGREGLGKMRGTGGGVTFQLR